MAKRALGGRARSVRKAAKEGPVAKKVQKKPAGKKPRKQAGVKRASAVAARKPGVQRMLDSGAARSGAAARNGAAQGGQPAAAPKPVAASPCAVDALCGGCQNVAVPYQQQLAEKDAYISQLFTDSLAAGAQVHPTLGMEDPYHYRNKVMSPFAPGKRRAGRGAGTAAAAKGKPRGLDRDVLYGMYQQGTHALVPNDCCLIENAQAKDVIRTVRQLMLRHGIPPYNEDTGAGFMRHCVVRVGHASGEVLVTLVTNAKEFPSSKQFCRELTKKCPFVTTVVQNVNVRQTNVVLGQEEHVLYGPGFILDTLCGLSFRISSQSFYQVNAVQTQVLYETAVKLAGLSGTQTVIDAYCGTGTIGLVAAKNGAARVIGVESVASAVRDARQNARHNGVENAVFAVADAGEFMAALAGGAGVGAGAGAAALDQAAVRAVVEELPEPAETVLMMDPPRVGSSESFLQAACAFGPTRIVYISCNPETQARDVAYLCAHGYRLREVQPVDMFPHTPHVESVALLSRQAAL